jgi:tetratricopeptide (TPR) repeat protein
MKFINLFLFISLFSFSVKSDQFDYRLPDLFNKLYTSSGNIDGDKIIFKIWNIWHETNDIKIEADFYRGMETMRTGDLIKSIVFFSRVIEKKPNFAEGWNKRATAYYMLGQFDKSMLDINQTLKLEPRHFGAMDGMILIFMHGKQYKQAIRIYDKILEIFPNSKNIKDRKKLIKNYLLDFI